MGWVFLTCLVVALVLGLLSFAAFKSSPGHGSGAFGAGIAGIFLGLLTVGVALASAITGIFALIQLVIPADSIPSAWGAGGLFAVGVIFVGIVWWQRRTMRAHPKECHAAAFLYWPCMMVSVICLLASAVIALMC